MTTISLKGEVHDLFSGVLHKVGGKIKSWNKRYFVLKSDYCLYYYKDTTKGALGTISLRDPRFKVRQGEASDISWPRQTKLECTMAIVTTHRTYFVYCDYSHEIKEWIRMLTKAREKMIRTNHNENKLLSGGRSTSSSSIKTIPLESKETELNYEAVYETPEDEKCNQQQLTTSNDTPGGMGEAIYDLAKPEETEFYEDIDPTRSQAGPLLQKEESLVLYEDVPSEETPQALYEYISEDLLEQRIDHESSSDEEVIPPSLPSRDIPPLPPKDDSPPLPPKDDSPPLPPKDDSPPLPHKDDSSPLPPKDDSPPLPHKDDSPPLQDDSPPLPHKDDSPPLPHKDDSPPLQDDSPPLPHKDDSPPLPHTDEVPSINNRHSPQLTTSCHHQTPPTSSSHSPNETSPTPCRTTPRNSLDSSKDGNGTRPSLRPRHKSSVPQEQEPSQPEMPIAKPRVHNSSSHDAENTRYYVVQNKQGMDECSEGMVLFNLQRERLKEFTHEPQTKKRSITLHDVTADPTLSPTNKAVISESLREVEYEKIMASEEKFKWERERKKLEEERQKFEAEKRLLEEEIQRTRKQLQEKTALQQKNSRIN